MAEEKMNLPGSTYEALTQIIIGYANAGDDVSLKRIASITGVASTTISRSNKFLADCSLIESGARKVPTDLGSNLGRALEHNHQEDIAKYWNESVSSNERVSSFVTTLRVRKQMQWDEFAKLIHYESKQKNNEYTKRGSNTIIDILVAAGLIQNSDGVLQVSKPISADDRAQPHKEDEPATSEVNSNITTPAHVPSNTAIPFQAQPANQTPPITINIQLQLPETENAEVYEKLFKALKENLLAPSD